MFDLPINKRDFAFYLVAMLFLLCGCGDGDTKLPIEEPTLLEILCDVHIVEGAFQNRKKSEKDSIADLYYQQVYTKHDVTEADFIRCLELLEKDPKRLEIIYSQVLVMLDTLEKQSYKDKHKKK